jgi:hypothetical protein
MAAGVAGTPPRGRGPRAFLRHYLQYLSSPPKPRAASPPPISQIDVGVR